MSAKKSCVTNIKGGPGKTTTAVSLASILGELGRKVLLIDGDPQGNSSTWLGFKEESNNILQAVNGNVPVHKCIHRTKFPNLDIIPSNRSFREAIPDLLVNFSTFRDRFSCLESEYDDIIIDCLPADNEVIYNAFLWCDYLVAPVKLDAFSTEGYQDLLYDVDDIKKTHGHEIKTLGILEVMYDGRAGIIRAFDEALRESFNGLVFKSRIPYTIRAVESVVAGAPLNYYAPKHKISIAYKLFALEYLERLGVEITQEMTDLLKLTAENMDTISDNEETEE